MINVAAWAPFLFWTTKNLFSKRQLRYAFLSSIAIALQFFAGHPQMTFFCLFIFIIYFLFEAALSHKNSGFAVTFPLASLALFIIVVVAIGLSAIQILPTLELTQLSERTAYTFQTATAYPFHPKNLMTFISPYYFGNPALGSYREDVTRTGVFWENSSYIGLLPFILAIAALIPAIRKKPRPIYLLFFASLALFSTVLMLGRFTPIYALLWQLLPGFQLFRFPTRFNLFLIFSLSILSGYGASLLLKKLIGFKNLPLVSQTKRSDDTRFSWPLSIRQTQAMIIGFILIDLFVFASAYIAYVPLDKFQQEPAIVKRLAEDRSFFRIYNLTQYTQSPYQTLGWKRDQDAILAIRDAIPPNNNLLYNLASFADRGWFEGGLGLTRRNRLENYLLYENQDPVVTGKILGIFNVKYITSFSESLGIEIEKIEEYDLGKQFATSLKLFKNNMVMPRVSFVPEAEVIQDGEAILRRLSHTEFLPTKTVILEDQPHTIPEKFTGIMDAFREENPLTILSYKDQEVTIEADIKNHGFLVLSDLFYPGWKAQVDGTSQPILKANYLVRALELEPGKHTIRFWFAPTSFQIGKLISLVALLILMIIFFGNIVTRLTTRKNQNPRLTSEP